MIVIGIGIGIGVAGVAELANPGAQYLRMGRKFTLVMSDSSSTNLATISGKRLRARLM